jgi:Ca2+-transporting ATPase
MQTPIEMAASLRIDGRASIEHQLSIHVHDLIDAHGAINPVDGETAEQRLPASDFTLQDVLTGLRYCMEYRIRGGKLPNLDASIMRTLAEALTLHMQHKEQRTLLRTELTEESDLSFQLFAEFIQEGSAPNGIADRQFRNFGKPLRQCPLRIWRTHLKFTDVAATPRRRNRNWPPSPCCKS